MSDERNDLKPIPYFATEAEERTWWEAQDLVSLEAEGKVRFAPEPFSEEVERTFVSRRGGARSGAGRKPSRSAKRTFKLSAWAIGFIDETSGQKKMSKVEVVEKALELLSRSTDG